MRRASGILAMAEGMSNAATARAAGRHVDTARSWRKRFTAERLAALVDRPQPLGQPRLSATDKPQVIAAATAQPPTTADDCRPPTPCGPTDCYPITRAVPAWRSPPPRSDGSGAAGRVGQPRNYAGASSPPATNWPRPSAPSSWPTTNTTPSPTVGPTTAARSKPHERPKDQRDAALVSCAGDPSLVCV
ncbi:helix-turn-helix domain-containing protein [Streptomyces sp. NPDC006703]|uniref:helix-turn-helix domain-containing protein n=1 Tax=Streptomyces sp. NPDC006703 TaxID=3364759 RepID=UPI0036B0628D